MPTTIREAGPDAPTPRGRPATHTHCRYCALQCAMSADPASAGEPARTAPVWFPTNSGGLCRKGWTAAALLDHPQRLTTPLIREQDELRPTDWDTALDRVASGIRAAQDVGGPDGVAVFGGGGLTNEKAYQLGKFARLALGSGLIDYNGRWCMSSAAAAANRSFGLDRGLPFPVTDLADARAVLLVGANPADTMPPFLQHLDTTAASGGLVVADPRLTATARRALDGGGLHLRVRPGTDAALLMGLLHLAVVADHRDVHVRIGVACAEGGDETVGDHPVSDDDDVLAHVRGLLRSCADQARKTVLRRCGGRSRGRDVPFTARRSRGEGPGVRGPVAAGSGERRVPSACW